MKTFRLTFKDTYWKPENIDADEFEINSHGDALFVLEDKLIFAVSTKAWLSIIIIEDESKHENKN